MGEVPATAAPDKDRSLIARVGGVTRGILQRAAEWYTANPGVRIATILTVNPGGPEGGVVDTFITTLAGNVQGRRWNAFMAALDDRLTEVEDRLPSLDRLASSAFFDTLRAALEAAVRTEEREKLRAYARLVAADAAGEFTGTVDARMLIQALLELSPLEIEITRHLLAAAGGEGIDPLSVVQGEGERLPFQVMHAARDALAARVGPSLSFHLARLRRVGFVYDVVGWGGGVTSYATTTAAEVFAILGDKAFVGAEPDESEEGVR